jgi:hypothetical protein
MCRKKLLVTIFSTKKRPWWWWRSCQWYETTSPNCGHQWWSCQWVETASQNCGHQWACCSSPKWYEHGHGGMMLMEENSLFIHQISGKPMTSHLVASRRIWRKEWESGLAKYIYSHLQVIFFTCRKILQHGASSFTTSAKEGMLRIFITFKNPSPWTGLNQRTLGPIASTLTITPPRLRRNHKPSPLK